MRGAAIASCARRLEALWVRRPGHRVPRMLPRRASLAIRCNLLHRVLAYTLHFDAERGRGRDQSVTATMTMRQVKSAVELGLEEDPVPKVPAYVPPKTVRSSPTFCPHVLTVALCMRLPAPPEGHALLLQTSPHLGT
eukprot:2581056-Rhodomonas_salina.2